MGESKKQRGRRGRPGTKGDGCLWCGRMWCAVVFVSGSVLTARLRLPFLGAAVGSPHHHHHRLGRERESPCASSWNRKSSALRRLQAKERLPTSRSPSCPCRGRGGRRGGVVCMPQKCPGTLNALCVLEPAVVLFAATSTWPSMRRQASRATPPPPPPPTF